VKSQETWKYIHLERVQLADTLESLSAEQWGAASWCAGWTVHETVGHIAAAAEQTPLNFYKELIAAGFKFNVFAERGAARLARVSPDELVRRLRARTTTTNHPPAPVMAMLGEIVVHGEDIRRPSWRSPTVGRTRTSSSDPSGESQGCDCTPPMSTGFTVTALKCQDHFSRSSSP
jgi:uncharacterized protein (TIGR03083 family)